MHLLDHSGYERQGITEFNSSLIQCPLINTGTETSLVLHEKEAGGGRIGGRTHESLGQRLLDVGLHGFGLCMQDRVYVPPWEG